MPGDRATADVRRGQILRAAFEVAARDGIGDLTIRAVAAEADLSHALVLFHFQRKERLVYELLDWLIETTSVLRIPDDIAYLPDSLDRLHALLQQEMARLSREPRQTRLFLEYWALGARHPEIRARIGAELDRYRAAFRSIMGEIVLAEPMLFPDVTADALAAVAVSWVHGCAVQALIDPQHFDTEEYLTAVRGIVGRLA